MKFFCEKAKKRLTNRGEWFRMNEQNTETESPDPAKPKKEKAKTEKP